MMVGPIAFKYPKACLISNICCLLRCFINQYLILQTQAQVHTKYTDEETQKQKEIQFLFNFCQGVSLHLYILSLVSCASIKMLVLMINMKPLHKNSFFWFVCWTINNSLVYIYKLEVGKVLCLTVQSSHYHLSFFLPTFKIHFSSIEINLDFTTGHNDTSVTLVGKLRLIITK